MIVVRKLDFPIGTLSVGFSGVPTVVVVAVALMVINTSSVRPSLMRVKLDVVHVCFIIKF